MKMLSRNCKAKSEASPVNAYLDILSVAMLKGEAGSFYCKIKPDYLLDDLSVIPTCMQEEEPSITTSLTPDCSLSTCSEQDLFQIPFSFP